MSDPGTRVKQGADASKPRKGSQRRVAAVTPAAETGPKSAECPWSDVDRNGRNLDVFNFPTALMTLVGAVLRRSVTLPYIEGAQLTFAEWKVLSVLGHGTTLSFSQIEVLAATDKSLVSRTLRLLEERALVTIKDRGHAGKKQLTSTITAAGQAIHDSIIVDARRKQADLLLMLSVEEREAMYRALQVWHEAFTGKPLPAPDTI